MAQEHQGERHRLDPDIRAYIERETRLGIKPGKILERLELAESLDKTIVQGRRVTRLNGRPAPSLRNVQRAAQHAREATGDRSDPWDWRTDDDPGPILRVLAAVVDASNGEITSFTQDEVEWLHLIERAAPDLRPTAVKWHAAKLYQEWMAAGRSTLGFDIFLGDVRWRKDFVLNLPAPPGSLPPEYHLLWEAMADEEQIWAEES
jgi:hypothetical protein